MHILASLWNYFKSNESQHMLFSDTFLPEVRSLILMQKQLLAEMVLFISLHTLPSLQRRLQSTTDSSIKNAIIPRNCYTCSEAFVSDG